MILTDTNSLFELTIVDYQYPPTVGNKYDVNWLVVEMHLRTHDNDVLFDDPCLLTWEALSLCHYLSTPNWEHADQYMGFMEPQLKFHVQPAENGRLLVDVQLMVRSRSFDDWLHYRHMFDVTLDNLAWAAAEWCTEVERFPIRASDDLR